MGPKTHDNARLQTANATKQLLDSFGWDVLNHPPYSPDLAPSDYHLFTSLKKHMGGKKFSTNEEVKEEVDKWINEMAAEFYEAGRDSTALEEIVTMLKNITQIY
ncbi:Hypothetical protein CINCED_3A024544 [Cinara cedri]|uniref:Uncharacterized protein n=1 Tax=Cinara cedri TaxID=506608 RepID=A0A5E4MYT7_9HEMI|nr:Hypothetical protein CINCED_3A024544 [Cinara cedri]